MKTVSMLELRQNSQAIIDSLLDGQQMLLTYRGKTVGKLVPADMEYKQPASGSNFYDKLFEFAEKSEPMGSLTNEEIDKLIYDP